MRLAGSVPPSVAASAIAALLELKERLLVEAALVEVISLVAGHLDVLPVLCEGGHLVPATRQSCACACGGEGASLSFGLLLHTQTVGSAVAPSRTVCASFGSICKHLFTHTHALQIVTRLDVLRRLWPMIALLQSPTDRTTAFAATWRTALDMHLQASEAAANGGCQRGAWQL